MKQGDRPSPGHDRLRSTPEARDAVQDALSHAIDAKAGYDVMIEKAEPSFRPTAQTLRAIHAKHAEQLSAILTALGGEPDVSGSVMSTVNRAVVSVRGLFEEIDEDAMDAVRNGEEQVMDALARAISTVPAARDREELTAMRTELRDALAAAPG